MNKLQAIEKLRELFHKTRLGPNISVPPEVVYAILYGDMTVGVDVAREQVLNPEDTMHPNRDV